MTWLRTASVLLLLAGCKAQDHIEILTENADDHAVVDYYFGVLVGADPLETDLLSLKDDQYILNADVLDDLYPDLRATLQPYLRGGQLEWDSLLSMAESTYDQIRQMPAKLAELSARTRSDSMLIFDVHGPMTRYKRRISVPKPALSAALKQFTDNGRQLVYPSGTVIIADHLDNDQVVESTAMYKRTDGYWEFGTYDAAGRRAWATRPNPRSLATPRQCVGCHFGSRRFEPEKSFPAIAPSGPDGARTWYTDARDPAITEFFSEHDRRSDKVLGLYATIYVTGLIRARESGVATVENEQLLQELGL